jgi:outer membrane protein
MKKYYFLFFFLFFYTNSFAEEKIVYLDINFLLIESDAGKYINSELKKINDNNIIEFKKIENSIKNEEVKLLKQKNILKDDEFNSKVNLLREKYKSYQELENTKNNDLKTLRDNAAKQLLKIINEILSEYSTKNKISLIMEKKNIVIGKTELDITKNILVLLNNKIKKVELKK